MKKTTLLLLCFVATTIIVFIACSKSATTTQQNNTTSCADSAYLAADTLSCSGYNFFYLFKKNKYIAVASGNAAIDSIAGSATFIISYDSIAGSVPCYGAIYPKALLTCYQRIR